MSFPTAFISILFPLLLIPYGWGCHPGDRAALLDFSNTLDSPVSVWLLANNESMMDCCRWVGVTCSGSNSTSPPFSRRVVELHLSNMGLSGRVSGSLGRLDRLTVIDLFYNNLSGSIPDKLFQPQTLEQIDLGNNFFSGPLSPAFGNLSRLTYFDVSSTSLSGSIPNAFDRLKNLKFLDIGENDFNIMNMIPLSLSSCLKLQHLDMSSSNLGGQLDLQFPTLPQLEVLLLHDNHFTGNIPHSILSCTKLVVLSLLSNKLSGQIPKDLNFPLSLRIFDIAYNNFSNITSMLISLSKCQNLTMLSLSGNFKKEVMPQPDAIAFPNMKSLEIAESKLFGTFPTWLSKSEKLLKLDLFENYFTGQIPTFFTQLKGLSGFKQQNDFDRTIITNTTNYVFYFRLKPTLDLSSNLLSGNTWMQLSNWTQLVVLNLSHNSFTGSIPAEFWKMKSLEFVDISSNQISGIIPSSLEQLTFLSSFCVANNNLNGDVPRGGQFSTFSPSCFDGNVGLCYVGKPNCYSPTSVVVKRHEQYEETYKIIDMGLPFAIGVSLGYATSFFVVFCIYLLQGANK